MKLIWAELTKEEFLLFILTLGPNEDKKWAFLKALQLYPRKVLRRRLIKMELFLGERPSSLKSYQGSQRIRIEVQRRTRNLPRTPKYSGYVKSIAALGKNTRGLELSLEELTTDGFVSEEHFNWFLALTVGEIPSP
jgi:hypothetical protein